MTEIIYQAKDAVRIELLKTSFGEEVTLTDNGKDAVYRIMDEFRLGGNDYAVLQPEDAAETEEYVLFRIVKDDSGNLELATIDDDEEWEAAAEVYDEMTFEP